MNHRSPLVAALLGLLLAGCGAQDDPHTRVSQALGAGVLLPAHQHWADANARLEQSARAFCGGEQDLQQARADYLQAHRGWAALQPLMVGPLSENNLAWQVQFWPDKKNLVARQVENLLKAQPNLTQEHLDKGSVVVQGLTAYEYVLFDPNIDLDDEAIRQRYCPLLTAIGAHQRALAARVVADWTGGDGMQARLADFPNDRYAEPQEAISDLLRTLVSAIDGLKKKLGAPLGRQSKGIPQPYQAEGWRSGNSLDNLAAALESAEKLWNGARQDGLRSLLGGDQAELAGRVDAAFADTRQRVAAFDEPLGALLGNPQGLAELNAFYDSLNRLHRLLEGDLARALGIQIGFNAHDGD